MNREEAQAAIDELAAELEELTQEEARNLAAYFATYNAELAAIMAEEPSDVPIGDEYCWHHDGLGNGGWCCAVCREEASK